MLLINFICLFYLMVLIRCDAISKSEVNAESLDDVSDEFYKLMYTRQDVPDPVSRNPERVPRVRKPKRPWLFMVPIDSYQSTAALERVLDNIKYRNMKQIASSPFGSTGMVFVTQPGYDREPSGSSPVKLINILNKENKAPNKIDAYDTTTELDELIYIDNLSIKERKKKRRTNHEEKVDSAKPCKEKVINKSEVKDYFKFLHPKGKKKAKEENKCVTRDRQDLLKKVPELPKDNVKSDTKHKNKSYKSNKDKSQQNRHQRDVNTRKSQENHNWLSNFKKREPHSQALDSGVYESLSNKLAYKDFVDAYKYYLNFEKDMAKSNFSDLVKYQAHKHHRVDDIGKFILEKLPAVPTSINDQMLPEYEMSSETSDSLSQIEKLTHKMERLNESADYDGNYEKYDFIPTKSVLSTPYSMSLLKKRLIDFRIPSWLGKSINSYSDSKTRSPRVRRHGIHFDTTQLPHSLKTERVQPKNTTKNVGIAKVNLVETAKTKKLHRYPIFAKFKKYHSKRDTQRASRSNFLNKLKQLFANRQTAPTTSRAAEGFDFQSQFYDVMKEQYPFNKASETSDMANEKLKEHTNRFSLDDYGGPKGRTSLFNDIPFELTTPEVRDPKLRKELHKLQQQHDCASSKVIEAENVFKSIPKCQTHLKELEARVKWQEHLATKKKVPAIIVSQRPTPQHLTKSWDYPEFIEKQTDYQPKSWQISELEIKNKMKGWSEPWQSNELEVKDKIPSDSWLTNNPEFKNKIKGFSQPWQSPHDLKLKNKQNDPHSSKINQKIEPDFRNIDKMAFHVRSKFERPNTNALTTDTMPMEAEKTPEFDKIMAHAIKNWSGTPAEEEEKTNEMPGNEDEPEFDKKIKTLRDMGFRVRGWAQNTDVINQIPMNKLIQAVTTETREDIDDEDDDDYMKDDHGVDEKQKKTVDQSKHLLNDDGRSTEERSPLHNKLLYDSVIHKLATNTVPYTKATETTIKPDGKSIVNAPPENLTPQKGEHNDSTSKRKVTVSKIFDVDITVTPTEKDKVTLPHLSPSPMLDRFDQEFPDFTKEGKLAGMEVLVKNWLEQHDATKAMATENSSSDKTEKLGIKRKNTDKQDKAIDIGRYIKDWLDKFDPDCAKLKTNEIINLKKQDITALDVGRAVKDWLDRFDADCAKTTTGALNTKNDKTLKTMKHRMIHVKDLSELDNVDDKTSTPATTSSDADHFTRGIHELDKPTDYTKKTLPNYEKPTTTPEKYTYLFEPFSSHNPLNPAYHENAPQLTKPGICREHPKPVSLKKPDKAKPKNSGTLISGTLKTPKTKEKVKSRPSKYHVVNTFDVIYTAHGNMPSENQSFNNFEAFFKKYSNLKVRNLRKSHMASTTLKTPILSKLRRQKRLTENAEDTKNKEVSPSVTPDPEMVDERVRNGKRETNEKHVVKNVAALEVLMDMMMNNDEVQQTSVEKPAVKDHESTNSVQVHLASPGNIKRSPKRVRKIFTARLLSPVDLEYQIHSYDDTLETTMSPVLPTGMYLLVDNYNSTSPRENFMLGPIPNDLKLSQVLQQQYLKIAANPDLENKKLEETTQNDKFSKKTLSKEFVSAVNEHLVQLYEAFARNDTRVDETTPHFKKLTLNSDFISVNIQRPEESQQVGKGTNLKLRKRETNKAFPSKNAIKKAIWEKKECNAKRLTAYEVCPVSDEVMLELISEMNSLVEYMNEHCTEIQTYFRNNPSGGRKLRDTVRKVNKLVDKYSKKASTAKSYYYKSFNKIVRKRHTGELIDVPQNYIPSNLIDDIENLASYISNVTKFRVRFKEKFHDGGNNLVGAVDKCVIGEDNRNERSVTKDKDVYSLDKVKVNIICKTEATSTTPNQMTVNLFDDNVNDESLTTKQWSLKKFLRCNKHMNKKSRDFMSRSWKREAGTIDSPLIADTSGSFWSNYMHKFQKVSHLESKRTSGETGVPMDNEKEIHTTKLASATTYKSTENPNGINKCSKWNSEITTSTSPQQLVKETPNYSWQVTVMATPTVGATSEPSISVKKLKHYSSETNTNENLNGKKERKIKPKHKEKHTKMTGISKPNTNKDKSTVSIDNPVLNEGDDINSASVPPTRGHLTITNSNPTQSASTNSKKEKEHSSEVKINNKSTFALKQLFKKIPGHNDKEKYKHSDVAAGPNSPSTTANVTSSTASITPSLVRNVIDQISKTGERIFQQWDSDNIVKYSGDQNSEEDKETNDFNLLNESQTVKNSLLKHSPGKAYGDVKCLLLSILQYETKRINNDTVCSDRDPVDNRAQDIKRLAKQQDAIESEYQVNPQEIETADQRAGPCLLLVNCAASLSRGNYLLKLLPPGTFVEVSTENAYRVPDLTVEITNEADMSYDPANRVSTGLDERTGNDQPEKDTNVNREKRALTWKKIKKWFNGERACRCKCKPNQTMCAACAASDDVMMEVIFRLNNLVAYIKDHSTEIENYFIINPSTAAEFRDAVKETDKCLENYSKRSKGKCHGKLCEAFKYAEDGDINDYFKAP